MPKFDIVYYAFLGDKSCSTRKASLEIIFDQIRSLKNWGLYDSCDNLFVVSSGYKTRQKSLENFLINYPKINNKYHEYKVHDFEFNGINEVYNLSQDPFNEKKIVLYFHSKGVFSQLHEQRDLFMDEVVKNFEYHLNAFEENPNLDISSYFIGKNGMCIGNFFWTTYSFVKNFCKKPEKNVNRYFFEAWLGLNFKNPPILNSIKKSMGSELDLVGIFCPDESKKFFEQ